MNRSVAWVSLLPSVRMGQQLHEDYVLAALRARAGDTWRVSTRSVSSLRDGAADVRVSARLFAQLPYALARRRYGAFDLVHRLDLRCPPAAGREVVTVHDLPPLRFDDEGLLPRSAAVSARRSAGVICPSDFAAREVRELLGVEHVWVVPNGVDRGFADARPLTDDERVAQGLVQPFVLHAGGATRRKNLPALAAAWEALAPDALLALCGPHDARRDHAFAKTPNVRYLGHVPHAMVARLMRSAAAVVVPSVYEGFGLPALEGLAAGVPVVAARRGALPEVCGDAAILVEPTPEGLTAGLAEALSAGCRLRAAGQARAARYTWDAAAAGTLRAYEEALS